MIGTWGFIMLLSLFSPKLAKFHNNVLNCETCARKDRLSNGKRIKD